ncbi:MAG: hypothetical protein JSR54_01120 [Proteobacteria bacterium]|nr:hypothetical protein [Pseudomonadota bacterium]
MTAHAEPDGVAVDGLRASTWRRAALLGGAALVPLIIAALPHDDAAVARDPDLVRLLHGMALIKGMTAVAALGAVLWRFGRPVSTAVTAAYGMSVWALWSAACLVGSLSHLAAAALLFHSSLLALLLVAWRDPCRARNVRH